MMERKYKIRTLTMLGTPHSWSVTMRSLFYYLIKDGHHCYLNSINGYSMCPSEWTDLLGKEIEDPDVDFCYTAPKNFETRFKKSSKLKMAIYNYETSILPPGWGELHKYLDLVLPSSQFSKEIFIKNGWPEEKCIVVPHGIHPEEFKNKNKQKLITNKPFRFLNVSIPHYRKNIDLLLDAYYQAFYDNPEVCLVLKTDLSPPKGRKRYLFEADVQQQVKDVQAKYLSKGKKNLPQIEIFQERVDTMATLYNACQVLVSATSTEGFGLPLLEGLAANMVVIAPNATGQKDFLNKNNSLLVDVKEIPAGTKYQYWRPSENAVTYLPKKDELSQQMIYAYKNYDSLVSLFKEERLKTVEKYTWNNAAKKVVEIINDYI